jgi:hypothetical protein
MSAWAALDADEERSVRESRARTLWLALRRCGAVRAEAEPAPPGSERSGQLCVHVVGADAVEAPRGGRAAPRGAEAFLRAMRPLAELLEQHSRLACLELVLVGPNVPAALAGSAAEERGGALRQVLLRVRVESGFYHDAAPSLGPRPALAVLFNAGLWGYDSWVPTLERLHADRTVTVVTSYNALEAEDDEDVVARTRNFCWLWRREPNPYASLRHRPSGIEGRSCADNCFWQCFAADEPAQVPPGAPGSQPVAG